LEFELGWFLFTYEFQPHLPAATASSACGQKERTTRRRVSLGVVKKYGSIQQVFQDFGKHAAYGESKYKCGKR